MLILRCRMEVMRMDCTAALRTQRMPTTRNEEYRFTDIAPILQLEPQARALLRYPLPMRIQTRRSKPAILQVSSVPSAQDYLSTKCRITTPPCKEIFLLWSPATSIIHISRLAAAVKCEMRTGPGCAANVQDVVNSLCAGRGVCHCSARRSHCGPCGGVSAEGSCCQGGRHRRRCGTPAQRHGPLTSAGVPAND